MATERLLVTVRTYPTISARHLETVCTAGITDNGEWRRLYPVAHRYLEPRQQYRTYDTITVDVEPGTDGRPETRRPDTRTIAVVGSVRDWPARRQWVQPTAAPSLTALIAAGRSIGPVAVAEVLDLDAQPVARDWTPAQAAKLEQQGLFVRRKPLLKVPFEFRFRWRDSEAKEHHSLFIAWEIGETWRQYERRYTQPMKRIREKWLTDLCGPDRDLWFFMGNHAKRRNVFMVCGIFNPPRQRQIDATLW